MVRERARRGVWLMTSTQANTTAQTMMQATVRMSALETARRSARRTVWTMAQAATRTTVRKWARPRPQAMAPTSENNGADDDAGGCDDTCALDGAEVGTGGGCRPWHREKGAFGAAGDGAVVGKYDGLGNDAGDCEDIGA